MIIITQTSSMHVAKDCREEQLQHNKFEEDQTQEIHAIEIFQR
jgi:predicted HTH domain antitoxin